MEIINRLRIRGNENAFMVKDADVTYPVFSTSLLAAEIFSQLESSGYKLCNLPFDFRKDGMSIMSLPVIDYTPTPAEEQDMFDIDSMPKMSNEEARSKISAEDVKYVDLPPTNYLYNTREEFIDFLKTVQVAQVEDVPIPINYFVHPNALFTVEEWRSGEYAEYFRVMEERRRMSYTKYVSLRNWLAQFFPNVGAGVGDFLEAYYAWGVDGLNVRFVNKKRRLTYISQKSASSVGSGYQLTYEDIGLVDRYGSVFPPKDIRPEAGNWQVAYQSGKEDPQFRRITSSLKEGELGIASISFMSSEEVLELQSLKDTFLITPYRIISGEQELRNFVVTTFDAAPMVVSHRWWSTAGDKRVYEMSRLRAIAYSIVTQRKRVADVSSYKALTSVGLDIRGALLYILGKIPRTTEEEIDGVMQEVDDPTIPTPADVQEYVEGSVDREDLTPEGLQRFEFIDSIIKGDVNIDAVAEGDKSDKSIDVRVIYRYLYALYYCRDDVDMDKLHKLSENTNAKVVNVKDAAGIESPVLRVEMTDGFVMNLPCPLLNAKIEGYNSDLVKYKVAMADDCTCFCKVTEVAREMGLPECNRHVAVEMKSVKLINGNKKTVAQDNLDRIIGEFDAALNLLPGYQRAFLAPYRRSSCMLEYFRVAEDGYMLLPPELGNKRIDFSPEFIQSVRSTIVDEITSTSLYSYFLHFNGQFTHFCVNADITPFKVYPRPNAVIPEVSITVLWDDIVKMGGSAIYTKLCDEGLLYPGFMAWNYRYHLVRHFRDLTDMPQMFDLCMYKMECERYRGSTKETEEYRHAPHMETLVYGYYPSETDHVDLGTTQRQGIPPLYVSQGTMLTKSMFPEHGAVVESKQVSEVALKPFSGFDAEDFAMLQDVTQFKFPTADASDKYIFVEEDGISTESQDNLPYYTIEQLMGNGYPIERLWGRKYVFRDMYGSLWEVRV